MRKILIIQLCCIFIIACGSNEDKRPNKPNRVPHSEKRSIYHWKNKVDLSGNEIEFIEKHKVERLYIRMFDVTLYDLFDGNGPRAIPTATVNLGWSDVYFSEIIPTVFITPDILYEKDSEKWNVNSKTLACRILKRIRNMCSFYEIPKEKVTEIQLDCDWTKSTEQNFFVLCKAMKSIMPEKMLLSSTIRLHQLRRPAPPVDYGVLMLYNTNAITKVNTKNSILDANDVKPYLRGNIDYALPLDFAFPVFAWDVWFKDEKFYGILRDEQKADSIRNEGNYVRHEEPSFEEIKKVKSMLNKKLNYFENRSVVLYHLSKNNINRFNDEEIEYIFGK